MAVIHRKAPYRKNSISFIIPFLLSIILLIIMIIFFSSWLKVKEIAEKDKNLSNQIILKNLQGVVLYRTKNDYTFEKVNTVKEINPICYVITDNNSFSEISLYDQNILRLGPNTSIILTNSNQNNTEINLENGNIWITKITSNEDLIQITTPNVIIKTDNISSYAISYNVESKVTTINNIIGTLSINVYQNINNNKQIVYNTTLKPNSYVQINDSIIEKLKLKEISLDIVNDDNLVFNKWVSTNVKNDFDIFTNKKSILKELIIKTETENNNFINNLFKDKNDYNIKTQQANYYKITSYLKDLNLVVGKLNILSNNTGNIIIKDSSNFLEPNFITEYIKHTVKQGETLTIIANKYKITVDDILKSNPDIDDPNNIAIGTVLNIPQTILEPIKNISNIKNNEQNSTGANITNNKNTNTNKKYVLDENGYYTVQAGDTLFLIGQAFNINYLTLAQINNISEPYKIEVGQKLLIKKSNLSNTISTGNNINNENLNINFSTQTNTNILSEE